MRVFPSTAASHKYVLTDVLPFPSPQSGYVTPWNGKGYEVAEAHASQINMISPVWYQIRKKQTGALELTGGHDYDKGWLGRVRKAGEGAASCKNSNGNADDGDDEEEEEVEGSKKRSGVMIAPRVIWEAEAFAQLGDVPVIIDLLKKEAKGKGYDGFTLEFPINDLFIDGLARGLKEALGKESILIVAIPSYQMPLGKDSLLFLCPPLHCIQHTHITPHQSMHHQVMVLRSYISLHNK